MELIMKISRAVEQIGLQKVKNGVFRSSRYNYVVQANNSRVIVYNLFTRGMIGLNLEEFDELSKQTHVISLENVNKLTDFLIENYYLVPENVDEQSVYCEFNDLINLLDQSQEITSYTVLTTTACNARCFYCFEKDFIPISMSKKTAHDLASYIIKNHGENEVSLHWFGGEPLCNLAVIDEVSKDLKAAGCAFKSNITSNGYAFTEELAKRAKSLWNVSFVQITLDGMADEHNRRKNFYGDAPNPFENIIKNIHSLLQNDILVSIRINLDQKNIDSVRELLSFLNDEFSGEKNLVIYPAKIFDDCGAWKIERSDYERGKLDCSYNEFKKYLSDANRLRVKAADNKYKYNHCGSNNKHHRTISPEGKFLACHNLSATLSYGSIYDGITDEKTFELWMNNSTVRNKCDDCELLPECTAFCQCPNLKSNCKEETVKNLNDSVIECYNRYLKNQRNYE